ncbi:MAG: ABC transporter permease [Actinomycetota bacterium]
MTATELRAESVERSGFVPSLPALVGLVRRAVTRLARVPAILAPTVIMPAFFIVAFTGSFDGISRVEGYPTDNIVNWVAAFAVLQSCAFAGIGAAASIATDLDTRFIDRLLVAPLRRWLVIAAPLGQAAFRALIPTTIILVIAAFKGASMPAGIGGVAMVYVGGMTMAMVMGLLGVGVVLLIGNMRAMAVVQVISFLVLFPSTGQVPLELMDGWLQTMARYNPATPMLAMTRQGFLGELSWSDTWPGLAVVAAGIVVFGGFARAQLRRLDG